MGKRRITFRFYKRTDRDLIGLYLNPTFNFPAALKSVLIAYVRGEPIQICPPRTVDVDSKDLERLSGKIILDDRTEGDVISWLDSMIDTGCRNSFLKNLFRGCMPGVNLCVYSSNPRAVKFEDSLNREIDNARLVSYDVAGIRKVKVVLTESDEKRAQAGKIKASFKSGTVKPVLNSRLTDASDAPVNSAHTPKMTVRMPVSAEQGKKAFSTPIEASETSSVNDNDSVASFIDDIDALF